MVVSERCWFTFMMVVLILNFYWFFAIHLYPYPQLLLLLSRSHVRLFATPGTAAYQASLFFPVSLNLLKSMSIESVMLCNHLILCHPLLFLPQSFAASGSFPVNYLWLRTKYWSFNFIISPSSEYLGLISIGNNWFDLHAVQDLLRGFSNTPIWKHQFFVLSSFDGPTLTSIHDYWKNHSFDYTDLHQRSDVSGF